MNQIVNETDINKNIYFLNNDSMDYDDRDYKNSIEYYNKLLYKSKIEIFIYNKKHEDKRYFQPKGIGEYKIKLKFNEKITDMSYMFYFCENITNIDLSSFDSKKITNISSIFMGCHKLTNIDLSSFDN